MIAGLIIIVTSSSCLLLNSLTRAQSNSSAPTCNQDLLDRSFVTQCSQSICEPVLESDSTSGRTSDWPTTRDEVIQIISSRKGDRFRLVTHKAIDRTDFYYEESHVNGTMFVDPEVKYQRILGFGTALTDASCTNVDDLPDELRKKLISDYFSTEEGIGINLIKIPIGSTKYSFSNYILDQPDHEQVELSPYDNDHRIPIIKDALEAAGKLKNRIKIIASSATAPPDFKTNRKTIHGGSLRPDSIDKYASYLNGFISAYKGQGINIWSLILSESPVSIANDKGINDTLDYNSMAMKPSDAERLIRSFNQLRASQSEADKFRLLLLGDDRAYISVWADAIFKKSELAKSVAGVAYVCDAKLPSPYDSLVYATKRYSNKYLLATEGSVNSPVKLGNWQYAENYATEIVKNLEYGSVGWIDFNMALNLEGGPVINPKFKANAAVMIEPRRRVYYRNPMFYAIGHLSRYVKPGSIRVKMNFYSAPIMYASQYAAFVTPDNYLVVFVMNNNINPMPISIGFEMIKVRQPQVFIIHRILLEQVGCFNS